MWCRSYRNHAIMAFPSFDTATNLWAPQANISWVSGTKRTSEFVRFPKRVFTEAEAAACALTAGQSWVDRRLKNLGTEAACDVEQGHGPRRREELRGSRSSKRKLTFDQFKSCLGRSDPNVSEQQLRKSYAALQQLRKRQHCSWANLMIKIRNSQAQVGPGDAARLTKSSYPPLTERDWRRII
jgi:hypothetical protein